MKPRICFLALNAYPTLAGTMAARVGGAEVQQCLIARYLVARGYAVSFITWDYGQPDAEQIDGITVYKAYKHEAGLPYLRFFYPRWTGVWAALKRANADVYYQRCAGMITGQLAAFCRRHDKRFVFASASDSDFDIQHAIISNSRDRYLYTYGLRRADRVITQTETQRVLLKNNYGRDAVVISNCWDEDATDAATAKDDAGYVLWVSTQRGWKRPERFVDLAERLLQWKFVMVGGPALGEEALYEKVSQRANDQSNLSFEGFIPFRHIGRYFDGARLVVNTSEPKEGFPNAFLQAWRRGIPVVSYFDPDGIIRQHALGMTVDSAEAMADAVSLLMNDPDLYGRMQRNVIEYFDRHHRIDALGPRYEAILGEMMA